MAGGRIAGITIKVGADSSDLQKSLKGVDKSLRQTQTALRDVNKLLKFDPGNTELLTQKQKLLKKSIEDTKTRLQQLKQAAKNATPESLGEEKYDALQREIVETESKLKNLKAQYKDFGSVAKQKLQVVSDKMKEVGAKMTSVGKSMTTSVTLPIVAGFTVAAKSASDYEENLNKIQVAFGDSADAVTEWANNAIKEFGLSKVAATGAVSSFGALGKGIGLTSDEAAGMSTTLAGLSADLASYFNTGTDESAKALEGIFTGETEALKKFGVVMNETNLKQFAEDQGLVYDEMSQTEKVMLRYNYVLEKTGDAQGDYSRTSDGTANSMKTFKAALEDLSVALGTQLLPIITPIIQKITEIVQKFSELDPRTQKIIVIIGLVVAAIGPCLVVLGTLVTAIGALLSPIGLVVAAVAGAIAVGLYLKTHWDQVCQWANNLKENVSLAFEGLKAAMTAKIQAAKDKVSSVVNAMKTDVSNKVTALKNKASSTFDAMKTSITSKATAMKTAISNTFESIKTSVTEKINGAKNAVSNALSSIKNILSGTLKFPHIEIPHFHISGGVIPWGIGGMGTPPTVSVEWYAKAMKEPYLLDGATIFGSMGNKLLGGGERGKEVIMGYDMFKNMGGDVNINMVVNAAPGMDTTELANMVSRKINKQVRELAHTW